MSAPTLSGPDGAALDVALARADVYRILAAGFRDPDDAGAEDALDADALRDATDDLGIPIPPTAWRDLASIVDRRARSAEHRAIFGHVVAHGCPPYETEYGRRHVFGQSQELGDIRGFYEAFGVRPRSGGERPDHLACELEFLALLALKEATALAIGDRGACDITRSAVRSFLGGHAGRWLPALAGRIAQRAPGSGYAAVAAVAAAMVAAHATSTGARPEALEADDLLPITEVPDGFAFECGVDAEGGDLAPPGS